MCEYGYLILTLIREIVCGLSEISLAASYNCITDSVQYSLLCIHVCLYSHASDKLYCNIIAYTHKKHKISTFSTRHLFYDCTVIYTAMVDVQ